MIRLLVIYALAVAITLSALFYLTMKHEDRSQSYYRQPYTLTPYKYIINY